MSDSGDTSRFSVGEQTGVIRMVVSPAVVWDFETQPNTYTLNVRATDFPGGTPQLSVSGHACKRHDRHGHHS